MLATATKTKFRSLGDREQKLFMAKISDLILYNDSVFDEVSVIIEENQNLIRSRFPDMRDETTQKPVFISSDPARTSAEFRKTLLELQATLKNLF
jgi:hypothetical protein